MRNCALRWTKTCGFRKGTVDVEHAMSRVDCLWVNRIHFEASFFRSIAWTLGSNYLVEMCYIDGDQRVETDIDVELLDTEVSTGFRRSALSWHIRQLLYQSLESQGHCFACPHVMLWWSRPCVNDWVRIVSFGGEKVQRMRSDVRLMKSVKVNAFAPSATNARLPRQYFQVDVIPEQRGTVVECAVVILKWISGKGAI
jgi:hypothetical protein